MNSDTEVKQKQSVIEKENINTKQYVEDVDKIRSALINTYKDQIVLLIDDLKENRYKIEGYLKIVLDNKFPEYRDQLAKIYSDIFEFAFINRYMEDPDFEEMNCNAWNDIEVITNKGFFKIPETFNSPEHAINTVKKMMLIGGAVLDEANPVLDSDIGTGKRITAMMPPVADKEVGITFSLRKLSGKSIPIEKLVNVYGSYSQDEVDFIITSLKYGSSMLFGGPTSSGKSSDMQSFLNEVFKTGDLRGFIIEEGTRELNFLEIDEETGDVITRVVHTKTRPSKSEDKKTANIDSESLVKTSLRYHPDIIVPAEMRGREALEAIEASETGHTVVSSAHVKSVTRAYYRLLGLCQRSGALYSEDMLMMKIIEAFPIVVFKKQMTEDDSRRCIKIFEATGWNQKTKKIIGNILFRFIKEGVETDENGAVRLIGKHDKINPPSFKYCQGLYENGCPIEVIQRFNPDFSIQSEIDYIEEYEVVE